MRNVRELNGKSKRMGFQVYDGMVADLRVIQEVIGMGSKSQAVRLAIRTLAEDIRKGRSFCLSTEGSSNVQ
jgi:hypothetical protein